MSEMTSEMAARIRAEAMTLQRLDGLWVMAEDYADLVVSLDAAKARIEQLEAQLAAVGAAWKAFRYVAINNSDDPAEWNRMIAAMDDALAAYHEARKP